MPAQMDTIKQVQKELHRDLKTTEAEVQSLEETIAQVKALGHPAEVQEIQLEKMKQQLKEAKQRIEDLWEYSIPYGQA
jgi:seryl-tRNA synthetase